MGSHDSIQSRLVIVFRIYSALQPSHGRSMLPRDVGHKSRTERTQMNKTEENNSKTGNTTTDHTSPTAISESPENHHSIPAMTEPLELVKTVSATNFRETVKPSVQIIRISDARIEVVRSFNSPDNRISVSDKFGSCDCSSGQSTSSWTTAILTNQNLPKDASKDEGLAQLWAESSRIANHARAFFSSPSSVNAELGARARFAKRTPLEPLIRYWCAENFRFEGSYSAAVVEYQDCMKVPGNDIVRSKLISGLAESYMELEDYDSALVICRNLISEDCHDTPREEILLNMAQIAEESGRRGVAASFWHEILNQKRGGGGFQSAAEYALNMLSTTKSRIYLDEREILAEFTAACRKGDYYRLADLADTEGFFWGGLVGCTKKIKFSALEGVIRAIIGSKSLQIDRKSFARAGDTIILPAFGFKDTLFSDGVAFAFSRGLNGWEWSGLHFPSMNMEFREELAQHFASVRKDLNPIQTPLWEQGEDRPDIRILAPWPAGEKYRAGGGDLRLALGIVGHFFGLLTLGLASAITIAAQNAKDKDGCVQGWGAWYYGQYFHNTGENSRWAIDFSHSEPTPLGPRSQNGGAVLAAAAGWVEGFDDRWRRGKKSIRIRVPRGASGSPPATWATDSTGNYLWVRHGDVATGFRITMEGGRYVGSPPPTGGSLGTRPIGGRFVGSRFSAVFDWNILRERARFATNYQHLDGPPGRRISVLQGSWVDQGTVMAGVDDTGNSAWPHLHFSLHDLSLPNQANPGAFLEGMGPSVTLDGLEGATLRAREGDGTCITSTNIPFSMDS